MWKLIVRIEYIQRVLQGLMLWILDILKLVQT